MDKYRGTEVQDLQEWELEHAQVGFLVLPASGIL